MILGYTGILFISQPWSQPSQTLGWILGMLSSLFSSIADLMSSSVVKRHGFWVPLTYSYLMPMILGGVLYILLLLKMSYFTGSLESIDPDALRSMIPISYQWVILSFVGLSSVFAHFFQIQSMACSSYFAAPFLYTRVIFSVILNILVYGIWPSATTYLGVFMIIIMAIAFYFLSKNKFVLEK
jgi:drug/metabolite transporter (DMT)-like permease